MVIPRLHRTTGVSGTPIPRPKRPITAECSFSIITDVITAAVAFGGTGVMPPPLASLPATTLIPKLVTEFGLIGTKLRSSRRPSEPQHIQGQCRISKEWM